MAGRRVPRLNSLLQEVLSEVITKDIQHIVGLPDFVSITHVEITDDLSYAKVYISVIGDEIKKKKACGVLNDNARQIAFTASRKVVMRTFPKLHFLVDEGLEKQLRIQEILDKVVSKDDAAVAQEIENSDENE